jgi:hypothetical protein
LLARYEVAYIVISMGRVAFAKRVKRRLSNATIDAVQALKKAGKETERVALLLWEEKPEWQLDGNQFIETGYRYGVSAIFSKISRLILDRPPADGSEKKA